MARLGLLGLTLFFEHGLAAMVGVAGQAAVVQHHHRRSADAGDAQRSVGQVADTLQNVRKSIEEWGRRAEGESSAAQSRCTAAKHFFHQEAASAASHLEGLRADLEEQAAAVQEAEGNAQQVRLEIAMTQRSLKQTDAMLNLAKQGAEQNHTDAVAMPNDAESILAMGENKRQTIASLQGELEVLLAEVAHLQGRAMETKRRVAFRSESANSTGQLAAALQDLCSQGQQRSSEKALARAKEDASVRVALQALQHMQAGESFVQMQRGHRRGVVGDEAERHEVGEGEHEEGGAGEEADASSSAEEADDTSESNSEEADNSLDSSALASSDLSTEAVDPATPPRGHRLTSAAALLRTQVQETMARLEAAKESAHDKRSWCQHVQAFSQLSAHRAQASADELTRQAEAHAEAQAEQEEELAALNGTVSTLNKTAVDFAKGATKEKKHLASSAKDQALATRILAQAVAVLADLHTSQDSSSTAKGMDGATHELKSAKSSLDAQVAASRRELQEVAASGRRLALLAAQAAAALRREGTSLAFDRDAHVAEQARALEDRRMFENNRKGAEADARDLLVECSSEVGQHEDSMQAVAQRALSDAEKVLDGESLRRTVASSDEEEGSEATAGTGESHEGPAATSEEAPTNNLSPLERAAAAMGVASDSN